MNKKINGSHQGDALGGRSKKSQVPSVPDDVVMRTDADVTNWLRGVEKANGTTNDSVDGIPELIPHADKRDLPPTAPGQSTRFDTSSDGEISRPHGDQFHNKKEKDAHGGSFDLGGQGRAYPPRTSVVEDAKERDPKKLEATKRRQFRFGNTN